MSYYDSMVKTAYEEIVGIDKEAAFEGTKAKWNRMMQRRAEKEALRASELKSIDALNRKHKDRKLDDKTSLKNLRSEHLDALNREGTAYGKAVNEHSKERRNVRTAIRNSKTDYRSLGLDHSLAEADMMNDSVRRYNLRAADAVKARRDINRSAANAAEMANLRAAQRAHRTDLAEAALAAKKAEAYYDEAQYIKEAAEADYAEACAYEDAALAILDELGYLD